MIKKTLSHIQKYKQYSKTNKAVLKKMDERNRLLCKMRTFSEVVRIVSTCLSNGEKILSSFIFISFPFSGAKPCTAAFAARSILPLK